MTDLFLNVLNLSINASWLVAAVVVLRFFLKKAPKWMWPVLWGLVALRLVCPVSIESPASMIPDPAPVSREAIVAYAPPIQVETPTDRQTNTVNAASGNPVEVATEIGPDRVMAVVWAAGVAVMLLYTAASYGSLRRKIGRAQKLRKNIYVSRNVGSPFVLGLFRPQIYLPVGLGEDEQFYILAHEEAHIRRRDHIWKPLGFTLLAVHWFNPLMWLAYILLCRDIELACDEKVIKQLGREGRADYSQALLSCAIRRRSIAACPLAFGEVGVKQRVKSVLHYKKPAFWVVLVAVVASIVVAVCFLTNPEQAGKDLLTLEDLRTLMEKGSSLTWKDLEGYKYQNIGTGREIFFYDVNENLYLRVYNAGNTVLNGPEVFELHCKAGDGFVDPRDRDLLEKFLEVHNKPLEEGKTNHWNLVLDLENITPTGTTVYVDPPRDMQDLFLSCDEGYTLWKKTDTGSWVELPCKKEPVVTQRSLPDVRYRQELDWEDRYGILPDGEYQLSKWVYFNHTSMDVGLQLSGQFRVSADGKPQLTAEEFLNRKKFEDEERWSTNDLEAYKAAHRNSWADYEDFAYVEIQSSILSGWRHRQYQLDNGMVMYMNGSDEQKRPNNIILLNGIDSELIMTDWVSSKETLAYAMNLLSQPLAPGAQDHMGVQLVVDSYSPTGATVSLVGTLPEHVTITPERDCWLQRLDDLGQWVTVQNLEGDTGHALNHGIPFTTKTLDWTEEYGVLPAGTYQMNINTGVNYENGEEKSGLGLIEWDLRATFTIGESQGETLSAQAKPFDPAEIHDLTQAVLCIQDAEYVITDPEKLQYLESLLGGAKLEKGIPGCPFNNNTYLTRADGAVFSFRHAEDSCEALEVGTSYYSYDAGLGRDFWDLFGIAQYYVSATYDDQGRVVQWDEYEWGRRVPNSTVKFTYDHAGNLFTEEKFADDGTTIRKQIFAYDEQGNQVKWWNYIGEDKLWSRGEREFDENHNLVKETSYQGDVLYLGTAYVHDDKGRILEKISTMEGEPSGTARYEWQDDHHYRVYNYTPEGDLTHSTGYVTDEQDRVIRREGFSKYGGSEGFEEYEYVEGIDDKMIVRYYDKYGKLTEEGWANTTRA